MNIYETVQEELAKEATAIQKVAKQLSKESLEKAFDLLCKCKGKVLLS